MKGVNFNSTAHLYEEKALVQKQASEILLDLIRIRDGEDVLDLGCGTGHSTRKIAGITSGSVTGVDVSEGMIREAYRSGKNPLNVTYLQRDAYELNFKEKYDVIFCNSVFQWFKAPEKALIECYSALKAGGRLGIQAPATSRYCPNFIAALEKVKNNPATGEIYNSFKSPWIFYESAEEYRHLFKRNGFKTLFCQFAKETGEYKAQKVYDIFRSGAENGYLNRNFYPADLSDEYIDNFRRLIKEGFAEQADESGVLQLEFNRIYLVAEKQ